VTIRPNQVLELIWIAWLISWIAASFWSARPQERVAAQATWTYRAAMIAGCILLVPWIAPLLGEKAMWKISYGGALALAAAMVAGLLLTWWARIHLGPLWSSVITRKKDHSVVDTGPYAFVRHPIYAGLVIALLATAAAEGRATALIGVPFVIFGLWLKAHTEERFLMAELGVEVYGSYCRRVSMLIPFLPHRRQAAGR
jgi:protein-S-isoprenylcysteine O-methyltransferase Ste14